MSEEHFALDDRAFLEGFHRAMVDFKELAVKDQRDRAQRVAERAKAIVHQGGPDDPRAGETRDAIGVVEGQDESGPYFDVGVVGPVEDPRKPLAEEFGTHKMTPRPFMRPALHEER